MASILCRSTARFDLDHECWPQRRSSLRKRLTPCRRRRARPETASWPTSPLGACWPKPIRRRLLPEMQERVVARADSESVLLAVLASPPLTTSGVRTRHRLDLAARLLGHERVEIVNLFSCPTSNVLDIAKFGMCDRLWTAARVAILGGLDSADAVIYGWGTTEPVGPARYHHREQVRWLRSVVADRGQSGWTVGGTPRHPSRWQRLTSRRFPGLAFEEALAGVLHLESRPASTSGMTVVSDTS